MPMLTMLAAASLCIATVHDGDTIRLCSGEKVRLAGIDAPELPGSPRCSARQRRRLSHSRNPAWCDLRAGQRSRDALRAFLASGTIKMKRTGHDKYGRTLARIAINGGDAGNYLIAKGLARQWR